jgi:6-pyruvoyltetrahydropterin/6-carboxytetrahydropterin synthase
LEGHDGKCANLHGHTYTLIVEVDGPVIDNCNSPKHGFVIDYKDLKSIVNEHIIDKMDHHFLSSGDEMLVRAVKLAGSDHGLPNDMAIHQAFGPGGICVIGERTTAEHMAHWIFCQLAPHIRNLSMVTLCETESSSAVYTADDYAMFDEPKLRDDKK